MSKDTGELIIRELIILCCRPIFSCISSLGIARKSGFPRAYHIHCMYVAILVELYYHHA